MEQIPTEVMEKINEKAKRSVSCNEQWNCEAVEKYRLGAEFGYRLLCEGKEKEIAELKAENEGNKEIARARGEAITELQAENERLKEQYAIMDGRRERAIKSLEESEKQFGELQEAYNKLIGGSD